MPSGSCMCGALTYSFTQPPAMKATCHCLTCRKKTGSTYLTTLMIPDSDFTLPTSNTHKTFTTTHEVGMSIIFHFCSECGTHLWKTAAGWPGVKIVFAGTLDGEGEFDKASPDAELWTKHRAKWVGTTGGQEIERFPGEWDREGAKWVEVAN